ncbi:MAG: flagellar hook capping FlgD N-terminal domain-containing protein [Fimbriimonadales bacterium]
MFAGAVEPYDGAVYYGVKRPSSKSELNMETFLRLLVTQLTNQNPLEPMNDRDFFAQMAQLGQVQGLEKMQSSLDVQQANQLMGKVVTAFRPMTENSDGVNQTVTGVVRKVILKNGERYVGIEEPGGGVVESKISQILSISEGTDVSSAAALLGKRISAILSAGSQDSPMYVPVTGEVVGLRTTAQGVQLQVRKDDGQTIAVDLSAVQSITQ